MSLKASGPGFDPHYGGQEQCRTGYVRGDISDKTRTALELVEEFLARMIGPEREGSDLKDGSWCEHLSGQSV